MSKRVRTSLIWKADKETFSSFVNKSSTFTELLLFFNLPNKGSNLKTLKKRLLEDNIDFSHIRSHSLKRPWQEQKASKIEDILVSNSSYNRNRLRNRLIKMGILINQCCLCGQDPEWNDKPLTLQLDHINGISDDNRLENLRILCPNCHTQTENFAGRANKKK